MLEKINKFCEFYQKYSRAPGRFKFTLKDEDNAVFNYIVYINIIYLDEKGKGELVLYIINAAILFQAARFLKSFSVRDIQDIFRLIQINVYIGPLEIICYNIGRNFNSSKFYQYTILISIITKYIPVKVYNLVGLVEQYHVPLQ